MRQYIISLLSIVCISIPGNIALAASTEVIEDSLIIEDNYLLTAYYSPLSDQSKYFRGSFEADKRLNGQGTHAADGTPVYFGMIAASPDIPYGSKVYIPGIGLCTAHDRGSAIQWKRIDIWMWHGDAGLARALEWGKKTREITIYLPGADIPDNISNQIPTNSYLYKYVDVTKTLSKLPDPDYLYVPLHQIKYGLENSAILELQKNLQTLGYYDQNPNGIYDDQLADAIFSLQKYYGIVTDENEPAAGYFGPKTSTQYKDLLKNNRETIADNTSQIQSVNHNIPLQKVEEKNPVINKIILSQWQTGESVQELQKNLKQLGYLSIKQVTNFYGSLTTSAIKEFQKMQNLEVTGKYDTLTQERINSINNDSLDDKNLDYFQIGGKQIVARGQEDREIQYPQMDVNLALWDNQSSVQDLHNMLYVLGYISNETQDTYYSLDTANAIFLFQKEQGILFHSNEVGSGVFGPKTRVAFNNALYEHYVEPAILSAAVSQKTVSSNNS